MSAENSGNAGYRSVWQDLRQTAFQQAWRSVAGVGTRYWLAGSSGGDVVLLHGTGGHLEAFARNLRALADRYRTWALDMPGHGWSDLAEHDLEVGQRQPRVLAGHALGSSALAPGDRLETRPGPRWGPRGMASCMA